MTATIDAQMRATKHNALAGYEFDRPVPPLQTDHYSVAMIEDSLRLRMFESVEYWGLILQEEIG